MKKTKLLSALTAVAVVATTMGTFAAWDTTSTQKEIVLTYATPVSVNMADLAVTGNEQLGGFNGVKEISIPVNITVKDLENITGRSIELTATGFTADNVDVKFYEDNTEITNGTDMDLTTTNYTAKVTLKDTAANITVTENLTIKAELK